MYLGIDVGTSGIKLVLVNNQLNIIADESVGISYSFSSPKELWSEQDPEVWWQSVLKAVSRVQKNNPVEFYKVTKIGLTGQQHGAVLLDKQGRVLRPAILWNDTRSYQECKILAKREPEAIYITANQLMPGFTAPKLLWVKNNEPEIFQKIDKVLLPKDYIRYKLSGDFATDLSDASGTSWLNISDRSWSEQMLFATNLNINHMPNLYEGTDTTGYLKKDLSKQWGLNNNIEITAGAGDNPASAVSINIENNGDAFLSLGTSGVYFVANNSFKAAPESCVHTMCHCIPNRWHHMSVHLSSAQCLDWFSKNILKNSITDSLNQIKYYKIKKNNIIFLPYLNGERTPHNDPYIRGMFYGLSSQDTDLDMLQAVLEGVAFAFLDGQTAMVNADIDINKLYVVGGGSRSQYWGKIIASVLNKQLIYFKNSDVSAAYGAANLCSYLDKDNNIINTTPEISNYIMPDKSTSDYYSNKYNKFQNLYKAIRGNYDL